MYCLYVLRLKRTGHFYVGVTDNMDRRQMHHYLKIKSAIEAMCQNNGAKLPKLYATFSKEILPFLDNWANLKMVIKESYTISVKCRCSTPADVSKRETNLIRRHKNNPLLLNTSLKSTYSKNKQK